MFSKKTTAGVIIGVVANTIFLILTIVIPRIKYIFYEVDIFKVLMLSLNFILFALLFINLRRIKKNSKELKDATDKWKDIGQYIGLTDFVKELKSSPYHPSELLPKIESSLDFMGHGASKWAILNEEKLDNAIERVKFKGGRVRILLFNPSKQIWDINEQVKILKSLKNLKRIKEKHNRDREIMEIRLYNHVPTFRLAFWNRDFVLVGHYKAYTGNSNQSPMLIFNSENHWGFYSVYFQYFSNEWELAVSLDSLWDNLVELYEKNNIPLGS